MYCCVKILKKPGNIYLFSLENLENLEFEQKKIIGRSKTTGKWPKGGLENLENLELWSKIEVATLVYLYT